MSQLSNYIYTILMFNMSFCLIRQGLTLNALQSPPIVPPLSPVALAIPRLYNSLNTLTFYYYMAENPLITFYGLVSHKTGKKYGIYRQSGD